MKEVLIAVIPSLLTLIGVIITVAVGSANTNKSIKDQTTLTLYRLEQVEKKQDKHNNLIERMYLAEQNIDVLTEKINATNNRIDELKHK